MSDDYQAVAWERAADRAVRRRYRSLWYRTKRVLVIGTVYVTAAGLVSIDPFEWFTPPDCGGAEKSASVRAQPAAVKIATDQGKMLRRLAGPPPTPEQTNKVATEAADAVVVTVLAFLASAKDKPEPAKVTAYNTAHAKAAAAEEARNVAACVPECPPGAPGPVTVAHTPGLTGEPLARAAATAAGFTGTHLEEAVAVARAESQFNPRAANPTSSARGMWQIMLSAHQNQPDINQWQDPYASARMAYSISKGGTDWSPWSVWPSVRSNVGKVQPVAAPAASCAGAAPSTYKTGAGAAWGGYQNGRIPAGALAHPKWAPRHSLRPDAAAAFDQLSAAYNARFGRGLGVTDSYRSYEGQVRTKAAKGNLAARPGTSNHGWGLAIDAITGTYSDARYLWLRANAPQFGWDNPGWARPGGTKNEPWHWEFNPTGART